MNGGAVPIAPVSSVWKGPSGDFARIGLCPSLPQPCLRRTNANIGTPIFKIL